ncbi:MAG: SPOR domain-containing protein [Cellvibrionaceae bacterium]
MDDGLKQRLVGALVLLALGVLFVPVLFEPENRRKVDRTTQVPPAPQIEPVVVQDPIRNDAIESVKPAAQMYELLPETETELAAVKPPVETKSQTKTKPQAETKSERDISPQSPDRKVLDQRGVPKAWAVQVASFNTQTRAAVLRDQLLDQEYPAFTRTLDTSKGRVTRVYVGPKINRDKALKLKAVLDKSLKVDTLVVKFSP